jgi:hypothetical protein
MQTIDRPEKTAREEMRAAVDIPIIASLNGSTSGNWTNYARLMEKAGGGRAGAEHLLDTHGPEHDHRARVVSVARALARSSRPGNPSRRQ